MGMRAKEYSITSVAIFVVSLIIYLATIPIFNGNIWALVIAFFGLLCSWYHVLLLLDCESFTWKIIKLPIQLYIRGLAPSCGYGVIFFFHVTGLAIGVTILFFFAAYCIAPILYLIQDIKKTIDDGSAR